MSEDTFASNFHLTCDDGSIDWSFLHYCKTFRVVGNLSEKDISVKSFKKLHFVTGIELDHL